MPPLCQPRNDHMHPVVDIVRHTPLKALTEAPNKRHGRTPNKRHGRMNARDLSPIRSRRRTLSESQMSKTSADSPGPTNKSFREIPKNSTIVAARFVPPPTLGSLARQLPLNDIASTNLTSRPCTTAPVVSHSDRYKNQKFPFLCLPPELRNGIYHLLLTTPNAPIELPRITRDVTIRAREWAQCKASRSKRAKFKSLFLEVLETCKQIHEEGNSILYGCNIFKFRSCHSEGPKDVVLPTTHLRLLKSIKVSVISREPYNGQDRWVANILKNFIKGEMLLESFEMSWYGWKRYHLTRDGLVCQTLQLLQARKQFTVKVLGEARMQRDMVQQLQRNIDSRKVEIHRPINAETGAELSDGE